MGFLREMFEQRSYVLPPVRPADEAAASRFGAVTESWTGVTVTPIGSLNLSAVYASVRAVADAMASLPLLLYKVTGRDKQRATQHPSYRVLKEQANKWMTAYEYRQVKYLHLNLWGNHFAEKELDGGGNVIGLFPIRPDRVQLLIEEGELWYVVTVPGGPNVKLPAWKIHHVKGLGSTGWLGYSPVALAANSMGLAFAAEEYGGRFFGTGGRPSGVLKHPGQLTDDAYERLKESWVDSAGLSNSHKVKILEEGMDYGVIGVPPEEAQFLQTRQFQVAEIARWFRVPPVLIGDLGRATYANSEQQMIDFVQNCLRPWASNDEQALRRDLLVGADRDEFDIEYSFTDLLRGDTAARFSAYQIGVTHGIATINEARAAEGLPLVANGDKLYMPLQVGVVMDDGMLSAPVSVDAAPTPSLDASPGPDGQAADAGASQSDGAVVGRSLDVEAERRELRALAGVEHRAMAASAFAESIGEVLGRTVRKEARDIRERLGLGGTLEDFFVWLKAYERELAPFMAKSLGPVLRTMMLAVMDSATREIGKESPGLTAATLAWVDGYTERYGEQYGASSYNQLRALYDDALQPGDDPDAQPVNPVSAIDERVGEWELKRADKESRQESINFANAGAIATWEAFRVSRKRWRANPGACGICGQLDGKVVGLRESFVRKGDALAAEGQETMAIDKDFVHAPLHGGCTCGVSAEIQEP